MGTGPILIFDKSMLDALSPDECVWLAQFYRVNMTPLFLVESLADLEKKFKDGRNPEHAVRRIAEKTCVMSADPNVHHSTMVEMDLRGNRIEMHRFVVMAGGRHVAHKGKEGVIYEGSPEAEALVRWRSGRFLEAERKYAKAWRRSIEEIDLDATYAKFKTVAHAENRPRSLKEVLALVDQWLTDPARAETVLGIELDTLTPREIWGDIFNRWVAEGKPILPTFAPYAAHVLRVDLFFAVALAGGFISKDRATNQVDIAYLYYVPFCMVFASMDKLHARTAPLFMRDDQVFIWGGDLKADLKRLDEHYSELPDEIKATGVWKFARNPPIADVFLAAQLWDRFMSPTWREPKELRPKTPQEIVRDKAILEEFKAIKNKATSVDGPIDLEDTAFVILEREVPVRLGKWQIVPPGVVEGEKKSRGGTEPE